MLDSEKQKKTNPEKKPTEPNPKMNQQEKKTNLQNGPLCKTLMC